MPRVDGCAVYGKGDGAPFKVMLPPDILAKRIEDARAEDPNRFITVPSQYIERYSEATTERSIYILPGEVWAIAPWLDPDEDEE